MNRGTALKLIDILKSGKYVPGSGQLRYENNFDVMGVLADFLDPTGWKESYIGHTWHGEKFFLPADTLKRCKIKHREWKFITDNKQPFSFADNFPTNNEITIGQWNDSIYYLEKYYDQI